MKKLIATIACLTLFVFSSKATTYYAAPLGSDSNPGTDPNFPLKDINTALNHASPYDTIIVNGIYDLYANFSTITVNKPITLLGIGAQLDGGGNAPGTPGKRLMVISNTSDVMVDGFAFKNLIGDFSIGLEVLGSGRSITILHCSFNNVGWTNNLTDIPGGNNNANAILVHGTNATPLSQIVISNDTITNCALGKSEGITIAGNTDTFVVSRNYIYANSNIGIDIAGHTVYASNPPPAVNYARNGLISHNTVYRCMSPLRVSAGIYLDGAYNCLVYANEVYQNGAGISIGQERTPGAGAKPCSLNQVVNNMVYNNASLGLVIGDTFYANPQTINNYIGSNTFYKNRTGATINGVSQIGTDGPGQYGDIFGGEIQIMDCDSLVIENNILFPLGDRRCINVPPPHAASNVTIQYNDFHKESGNVYFNIDNGSSINGQAGPNWHGTNTLGLDTNTISIYPKFVDTSNHNFRLDSTSLCIDAGNPATNAAMCGPFDYYQVPRVVHGRIDIGAAESQSIPVFTGNISPNEGDLAIYPNPAKDILYLVSGVPIAELQITDMQGRMIRQMQKPGIAIDIAGLRSGVYDLRFVMSNGTIGMRKMIKL